MVNDIQMTKEKTETTIFVMFVEENMTKKIDALRTNLFIFY